MTSTYTNAPFLIGRSTSLCLAGVVTLALLLLMQALITVETPVIELGQRVSFDPVMAPPEDLETLPEERLVKPEPPASIPEWSAPEEFVGEGTEATFIGGQGFDFPVIDDIGANAQSSTIVPIFRIAPDYPAVALRRGIEGYVDLVFDVTASGRTSNIRVLDAQPRGVFERAAIRTLKKWKYKAPTADGVPYVQQGMTTRISFRLEV